MSPLLRADYVMTYYSLYSSWTYLISNNLQKQMKHIPIIPGPSGTRSKCQSIQISPLKSQPITIMDIGFGQMREQEIKKGLLFVLTGTCSWSLMVLGSWECASFVSANCLKLKSSVARCIKLSCNNS